MAAFFAVYLREMIILRRRLAKQLAAAAVSPLLYMLAFGYALAGDGDPSGARYLAFLLPGLAAMGSMTQAFGMASEINIARFYSGVFEEIQASPAGRVSYVLGEMAAGLTRVALGVGVILVVGLLFGVRPHCGPAFWLAIFLNGAAFSALAVALAMLVRSHADQSLLNTFVITPMAFLGGTFFPVERLPAWLQAPLTCLPLTHAARAVRAAALGEAADPVSYAILAGFAAGFFLLAVACVGKARD